MTVDSLKMEILPFTKMHGLGNDFILIEYEKLKNGRNDLQNLAAKMCSRKHGIGADGLIIVYTTVVRSGADIGWRIFNSDGSEPEMCGNGIRCFSKFVIKRGIVKKNKFAISTLAGLITTEMLENGEITVDMGTPVFESSHNSSDFFTSKLTCHDKEFLFHSINMGNPHCVIFIDIEDGCNLARKYGKLIEYNKIFPEKTNVEFVKVLSKNRIKVDVWERGCGITLSCGTGACAAVVAAIHNKLTENLVTVDLPGGPLSIEWRGNSTDCVKMTGCADFVFDGNFYI